MMLPISVLDAIIIGGMSVKDFAIVTKLDHTSAKSILLDLVANQIGLQNGEVFEFSAGDKLRVAMLCLQRGAMIDDIAANLNWKDFEGLVSEILSKVGFATIRNHIIKKPRREIDVIGIKAGVAMLIDCKHWKRTSTSAITSAVLKQIERTKQYVAHTEESIAVPVIVTLYEEEISFSNKVPIVPVHKFASFVDEFYGNLEKIETIEKT
ncbi:MAG: hypothetical protein K8823_709 [Cenarchaeum symbiont of Oopsacas minuta]|nr:hypothetical protein [Cenarchaeum symbiont of Oopsacas minuta]